jgi:hypothetical protein
MMWMVLLAPDPSPALESVNPEEPSGSVALMDNSHVGVALAGASPCSYGVCQAPWGGRKALGHGRTHARSGLYALSQGMIGR